MDADSELELYTRCSWTDPGEPFTHTDHMTSRNTRRKTCASAGLKIDHRAVSAVLTLKTKIEIHDEKRCQTCVAGKPDDSWERGAAVTLTDCGNWDVIAPLLKETAKAHKILETKEMTTTQLELKSLLLKKKREGRHLERAELKLALSSNLVKEESVETRKTLDQDQGECRDGERQRTQSKHINWSSIAKQENPDTVLINFFQDLYVDKR